MGLNDIVQFPQSRLKERHNANHYFIPEQGRNRQNEARIMEQYLLSASWPFLLLSHLYGPQGEESTKY